MGKMQSLLIWQKVVRMATTGLEELNYLLRHGGAGKKTLV